MSTDQEEGSSSLLAFTSGAIIGGLIGTAIGMFLAPKSGSEMRYQLSENVHDAQNKTKQMLDETKVSISQNVDKAAKNLETTVQKVTEAFNAGRKAAQDVVSDNTIDNRVADEKNSGKIDKSDKLSVKMDKSDDKADVDSSDKVKRDSLESKVGEEVTKENKAES